MGRGQLSAHAVERMGERVGEPALGEEADELVDRAAEGLQVAVVRLGQVPHEHVQRRVVLGEAGRHLDRHEGSGAVGDPKRTLERVVVADRDQVHPARAAAVVNAFGCRERLTELCAPKRVVAAVGRVDRVDVQVATGHCLRCTPAGGLSLRRRLRLHRTGTAGSPDRNREGGLCAQLAHASLPAFAACAAAATAARLGLGVLSG